MLSISFISAVNRKRKKRREAKRFGSSTDDDSEHEPAKSANLAQSEDSQAGERVRGTDAQETGPTLSCTNTSMEGFGSKETKVEEPSLEEGGCTDTPAGPAHSKVDVAKPEMMDGGQHGGVSGDFTQIKLVDGREDATKTASGINGHSKQGIKQWQAPEALQDDRIPADARSIVSGYSTLSTIDHSVCSEVQSVAESRGDEADDERSEFSHLETDTESGFTLSFRPQRTSPTAEDGQPNPGLSGLDSRERLEPYRGSEQKLHSRPSFNSHRLIKCDTLARKKLSRVRQEGVPLKEDSQTTRLHVLEEIQAIPPFSSQESLPHQPERMPRASVTEQLKQRLKTSADDMFGVGMRKPSSPETRRKKSAWRRHTVVVQSPITDFNFNEWKEKEPSRDSSGQGDRLSSTCLGDPKMEGSGEAVVPESCTKNTERLQGSELHDSGDSHRDLQSDWKDSGLSSLESTKTRPSSSSLSNAMAVSSLSSTAISHTSKDTEGLPVVPLQVPKHTASSRFHQYL